MTRYSMSSEIVTWDVTLSTTAHKALGLDRSGWCYEAARNRR